MTEKKDFCVSHADMKEDIKDIKKLISDQSSLLVAVNTKLDSGFVTKDLMMQELDKVYSKINKAIVPLVVLLCGAGGTIGFFIKGLLSGQ